MSLDLRRCIFKGGIFRWKAHERREADAPGIYLVLCVTYPLVFPRRPSRITGHIGCIALGTRNDVDVANTTKKEHGSREGVEVGWWRKKRALWLYLAWVLRRKPRGHKEHTQTKLDKCWVVSRHNIRAKGRCNWLGRHLDELKEQMFAEVLVRRLALGDFIKTDYVYETFQFRSTDIQPAVFENVAFHA